MKSHIYKELNNLLKKVLLYLEDAELQKPDIDEIFIGILKKFDIDIDYGILNIIYSFLDVACDSKEHLFKEVSNNYSFPKAIDDLRYLIKMIEMNNIVKLETNSDLINRLSNLYK